jgi:hypothetical protein
MHTDLGDTVDRIDCTGFAEVTELDMVMPAITEPSSARLVIRAVNLADMEQAVGILRGVAKEKNLLIIEPLEDRMKIATSAWFGRRASLNRSIRGPRSRSPVLPIRKRLMDKDGIHIEEVLKTSGVLRRQVLLPPVSSEGRLRRWSK